MGKYVALIDIPPNIKAGDVIELGELTPDFEKLTRPLDGGEAEAKDDEDPDKEAVINPSRDELKARATELGINFAPNMPTERLMELVKEAEEKAAEDKDE